MTIAHPPDPVYRASLFGYLSEGSEMAKKFISMLLGDTQLHFDDGLLKLAEAKKLQEEEDAGQWEGLPENTAGQGNPPSQGSLEEKKKQLEDAENHARHMLNQTAKTIHFLAYVTLDCPGPFLAGIFVHRIAQMLNSFIVKLAGRKMGELKVRNMDELEFKPLELLEEVASVFVHLFRGSVAADASSSSFAAAMLSMGQYDAAVYRKALSILSKKGKTPDVSTGLAELLAAIDAAAEVGDAEDIDLDDCPDEFLDPLMDTLMDDPVKLPCGTVIDRVTIERSLLDNEINPFSREPMTTDDLVPDDELKARIQKWVAARKAGVPFEE